MNPNIIIAVGLFLRIGVAVWNGYFGPSLGAELDAQSFYYSALAGSRLLIFQEWEIGPNPYINMLTVAFYLINDSLFFGSLISCVAWLVSAILLSKSIELISQDNRVRTIPLLVYVFAPAGILITGVTLREPFQLLFINLAIFSVLRIAIARQKHYWPLFVIGCVGAGYLHGAMMGFVVVLIPSTVLFVMAMTRETMPWGRIFLALLLAAILLPTALTIFSEFGYDLSGGLLEASLEYQEGGLSIDARANYKTIDYNMGLAGTLWTVIYGYYQYLMEPLPQRVGSLADLGLFIENVVRLCLVYLAVKSIRAAEGKTRYVLIYLLMMFGALEFIWSLGTVNWGTASRHHVPSLGLLAMASSLYVIRRRSAGGSATHPSSLASYAA